MIHGIWINGKNTLSEYGLALLADLSIGSPEPRMKYIEVPEADGNLDFTEALTGGVVRYGMRTISLQLYPVHDIIAGSKKPATEEHAALIRQKLMDEVHGRKVKLWLPDDPRHYFLGRMAIGDKGGFNNTTIPITMTAEPWRYKNLETEIRITSSGRYNLANETRRVIPVFTSTTGGAVITFGSVQHTMTVGNNQWSDIQLQPGRNLISITGVSQPVIVKYQEAVF